MVHELAVNATSTVPGAIQRFSVDIHSGYCEPMLSEGNSQSAVARADVQDTPALETSREPEKLLASRGHIEAVFVRAGELPIAVERHV